jgi:hypothetical protein
MSYYLDDSVTNVDILTNIGFKIILESKTTEQQKLGISYLERTLAESAIPRPYSIHEPKGVGTNNKKILKRQNSS